MVTVTFAWVFFLFESLEKNKWGSVRIVKNCDLGLENAALGLRPQAAFSRPRSQFFTIWTSQPANNIYFLFCFNLESTFYWRHFQKKKDNCHKMYFYFARNKKIYIFHKIPLIIYLLFCSSPLLHCFLFADFFPVVVFRTVVPTTRLLTIGLVFRVST